MTTAFSRTLRSLEADRFRAPSLTLAALFLAAWVCWSVLARVTLYEVSTAARLEVEQAVTPIESPVDGRVLNSHLAIGREVRQGDVLVELDTHAEQLDLATERARLNALTPQLTSLRNQIAAEQQALTLDKTASATATKQALSSAREAEAPARFAEDEAGRLRRLRAEGLIAERDYQRAEAELQRARAVVETQNLAVPRIEQEQRTKDADRLARISSLSTDIARIESQIPAIEAAIARLSHEIERRRILAPTSGKLGEAAILQPGSFMHAGDKLGAIIPTSRLAVIAQFSPASALGRLHEGQKGQLRLDGFPWARYGVITATVRRVASEVRDRSVRVELTIDSAAPAIPLQHGLPGTIEVAVERASPASLLLRHAGRMVSAPRAAFAIPNSEPAR